MNYREAYGLHACNGILFNHESPRRGETFVTRKITRGGDPNSRRAAGEAVSGQSRRQTRLGLCQGLRRGDVADAPARRAGRLRDRDGRDAQRPRVSRADVRAPRLADAQDHVEVDPRYFRPSEVDLLLGDATKARERLGWRPETSFEELVKLMVDNDWMLAREERVLAAHRGG